MFCTNCGKELVDGAYACPYCGNVVENAVKAAPVEAEQPAIAVKEEAAAEVAPVATEEAPQYNPAAQPEYNPAPAPQAVAAPEPTSVRTHPMTIIGFVLAFFVPIAGLIISLIAKKKIANDPSVAGNAGMNKAGIILSIIFTVCMAVIYSFAFIIGFFIGLMGIEDPSYAMFLSSIL